MVKTAVIWRQKRAKFSESQTWRWFAMNRRRQQKTRPLFSDIWSPDIQPKINDHAMIIHIIFLLTVSVLHRNEGGVGKSIPDAWEISRDPRDVPTVKPERHFEVFFGIFQYLPSFGGIRTFYHHQCYPWEKMYECQSILNLIFNPSLLMVPLPIGRLVLIVFRISLTS